MTENKDELREYILSIINKKTTSELADLIKLTCSFCHHRRHHSHFGWSCTEHPYSGGGDVCKDYNSHEMEEWRARRDDE